MVKPSVSIVGAGNLGTALARALHDAGYQIRSIATRQGSRNSRRAKALARRVQAQSLTIGQQALDGDVVWLTVPDDAIADTARAISRLQSWKGKTVFHSSGALTSDQLQPLRRNGARVASVHPMMTFVRSALPNMRDIPFGIEGDAAAARVGKRMVGDLGATSFAIGKREKALYHAFASFASPLLIALLSAMEQVANAAGIPEREARRIAAPLLQHTLRNYLDTGAGRAFTGPLARGDIGTIRKHLKVLLRTPDARNVYLALARAALSNLPVKDASGTGRELRRHVIRLK